MTHPHLPTLTDTDLDTELSQSKQILEQTLGINVTSFALPYGDGSDDHRVMQYVSKYYDLNRGIMTGPNYFPTSRYNMLAIAVDYHTAPATVIQSVNDAMTRGYWLVLYFHFIVSGTANQSGYYAQSDIATILNYLKTNDIPVITLAQGMAFTRGDNLIQNSDFTATDSQGWALNWTRIGNQTNVLLESVSPFSRVFATESWLKLMGPSVGATTDQIAVNNNGSYLLSFFTELTIQSGSVSVIVDEFTDGVLSNSILLGSINHNQVEMPGYLYYPSIGTINSIKISVKSNSNFSGTACFDDFFFGTLPPYP